MSAATTERRHIPQTENGTHKSNLLEQTIVQTTKQQSLVGDAANILGVAPGKLFDLLRNVWKTSKDQPPLTDQEMFVGVSLIARYHLDPIAREVYVTRGKGGIFAIVSIDGWIKILDRTDHYDGFTVELHESAPGVIDWCETTIHSTKRKHPTSYKAFALEYSRVAGMVAKQIPSHMLRIFSLRHAARLFTPIGGNVLTEEEAAAFVRENQTQATPTQLDELTERLSKPVEHREELPESSYQPQTPEEPFTPPEPPRDDWQQFNDSMAAAKTLADHTHASDYWLAKDFGAQRNTEAIQIAKAAEERIRAAKGKQRDLV